MILSWYLITFYFIINWFGTFIATKGQIIFVHNLGRFLMHVNTKTIFNMTLPLGLFLAPTTLFTAPNVVIHKKYIY
jgi:hypothetical protein